MIKIIKGCLLEDGPQLIAHQVNTKGVMGAGIAKTIKEKYPENFNVYKEVCEKGIKGTSEVLGNAIIVMENDHRDETKKRFIADLFGQNNYGRGRQFTDIEALKCALTQLKLVMVTNSINQMGIPYKIGCGHGGADWMDVLFAIQDVFEDQPNLEILIYDITGESING